MAVSRNIRTIYVTNYDKSIGDVFEYLGSGSGDVPLVSEHYIIRHSDRSTVTGVHQISIAQPDPYGIPNTSNSAGTMMWGESSSDTQDFIADDGDIAFIDYTMSDSATTMTFDKDAANLVFSGVSEQYPGYLIIPENGVTAGLNVNPTTVEIMSYTTVDQSSPWREISGITRGVFNTLAQEHVGTALDPLLVMPYVPGSVQTIEYEPEDGVYAVNVAIPFAMQWKDPLPQNDYERLIEITEYRIFRFEIPKDRVDLVVYQDSEYATNIAGWIGGFSPWNPQ